MTRGLVVKYLKIIALSLLGLWLVGILWEKVAPEMTLPIIWGTLAGFLILFGFGLLFYRLTRPKTEETEKSKDTPSETLKWVKEGAGHSLALITAGLIIFNLVSWAMIPWWWNVLFHTWYTLVFFNIAMGAILFLITLKQKGPDGKDTKDANPTASRLASLIGLLLVLGIGTVVFDKVAQEVDFFSSTQPIVLQPSFQPDLAAEIALPLIAECESGGKHFEDDGVTPLKNKEGSSAIGKYQILASAHEERAKSMGFDIKTPEGNEGYARVLYNESGTKHWEVDPRGKACWGPKLAGQTSGSGGKMAWILPIEAPVEKWSDYIPVTNMYYRVDRENPSANVEAEYITTEGTFIRVAPRDVPYRTPGLTRKFRFRSLDKEPAKIKVTLTPQAK
jgi:hypothetical protein